MQTSRSAADAALELPKAPTGIVGLDDITNGGLPRGRPTLVCGSAGCGKTLLAMEFLVRGATEFGEPGVFMAFEETADELAQNVRSLGFDLEQLIEQRKLVVDYVRLERSEIDETGEYDLEGLFIRLGHAIDSIGAKRVALDTLEVLFAGLDNTAVIRAELRRLFRWLKDKGVSAVITGERGDGSLTRHGLEEYVSDCVILLDHRVDGQVSTRRLRIVKYRGTTHGTNEYPFLIDRDGFSVLPITSLELKHEALDERLPSGVARLDAMLAGGVYRGSSILISGTAGTGKTSIAAQFTHAACARGERCLFFAFEESAGQLMRNMRSIGIDLKPWIDNGRLVIDSQRPTMTGLEMHLTRMHRLVHEFKPSMVVVDPISNFGATSSDAEARLMLMRLVDFLKSSQATAVLTNLTPGDAPLESTDVGISSLIDTWILLRNIETGGERNRGLVILKARGIAHSNQVREFLLSKNGIELRDIYVGADGVLTGSMRLAQEAREQALGLQRERDLERRRRELERDRALLDAQIHSLRHQFAAKEDEINRLLSEHEAAHTQLDRDRHQMALNRRADSAPST